MEILCFRASDLKNMEQHPVPQHIAAYQFHLVGDMTLKQFVQLAAGIVVAWLIYSAPINPILKWPMMLFSACFGAALAFLPFEERPLDAWIINFFKAIYSPTVFLWKKEEKLPDFLQEKPAVQKKAPSIPPKARKQLLEYLGTLPVSQQLSPLDDKEEKGLEQISKLFQSTPVAQKPLPPASPAQPQLPKDQQPPVAQPQPQLQPKKPQPQPPPRPAKVPEEFWEEEEVVLPAPAITPPMKVKSFKKPEPKVKPAPPPPPVILPPKPEAANIIVGIVVDQNERIIPEVIIEIKDKNGNPVRALKSNKLGQFFIATPLSNGPYKIELEKESFQFDIIKFEARGEVIPPMKIVAKNSISTNEHQ